MNRVLLNRCSKIGPDRSRGGFGGVCCAHHFPIDGDCVFPFEHLHEDGARCHEVDEVFVKGAVLMDFVKRFRLFGSELDEFCCDDMEACRFEVGFNVADVVLFHCVGFDNGECLLCTECRGSEEKEFQH